MPKITQPTKAKPQIPSVPTPAAPPRRPVKYPEIKVRVHSGDDGLTAADAEALMGVEWEADGTKFGPDFLFRCPVTGIKARAANNVANRPLYWSTVESLVQKVLNRRWSGPNGNGKTINGEPMLVGEYGSILNGQHTNTALIVAQRTLDDPAAGERWRANWPGGVVRIDKLVVYGISEDDDVVNTMDTCKPRSITDVLYRSPYFADLGPADRARAARATDYAVRTVWHRTGMRANAYAPRLNHEEALAFLGRHPRFVKAVVHVLAEGSGDRLTRYVPGLGTAAALLYLMAASGSDGDAYRADPFPEEAALDLGHWSKAEDFWGLLAADAPDLDEVRYALAELNDAGTGEGGTGDERVGVIVKAWDVWLADGGFRKADPRLRFRPADYAADAAGGRRLVACPILGGIDVGKPEEGGGKEGDGTPSPSDPGDDDPDDVDTDLVPDDGGPGDGDPTPDEIEAAKMAEVLARAAKAAAKPPGKPKPAPASRPAADPVTGRTPNNETPAQAKKPKASKPKAKK